MIKQRIEKRPPRYYDGRILLDPDLVWGEETTFCFNAVSELLQLTMKDVADPDWFVHLRIEGGKDVGMLPLSVPVGTKILVFNGNGRIDRFEIVRLEIAKCFLRRNKEIELRYQQQEIGQPSIWPGFGKEEDFGKILSPKIVRLVVIYPNL